MALTPPFSVCKEFCVGGGGTGPGTTSIKDLGTIETQEQLNNLVTLSSGNYKFTSPYEMTINRITQHKVEFIINENSSTVYNYELKVISDGMYYRQDISCDKISRKMYRQGDINFALNAGYIFDSENDIEFKNREAKILSERKLDILSSDNFNLEADVNMSLKAKNNLSLKGDEGIDIISERIFLAGRNAPQHYRLGLDGLRAPLGYGMYYFNVDNTNEVSQTIGLETIAYDYTYLNNIENLVINLSSAIISGTDGILTGFHFNTGDTAPRVSYAIKGDTIINWQGTDCALDDGKSVFEPSANMHYDIFITYMGGNVIGAVKGYKPATSNQ